ncbi:hypothetical protein AAFF_G00181390 [Aldrovandia affinis]|uniref:Uncharacterized protein n=1 Tax=Aldrovandia affinis TaxID=143900 RepID=A0AAD7WWR7_9TELE|nr:hypothetical protein AAFF_G00181390 [Aldrovandia affinis]
MAINTPRCGDKIAKPATLYQPAIKWLVEEMQCEVQFDSGTVSAKKAYFSVFLVTALFVSGYNRIERAVHLGPRSGIRKHCCF